MAVRILTIGDPHFKITNPQETEEMHQKTVALARDSNLDQIIILGDTLDKHETIHVSPQTRAIKFINALAEIAPVVILIGNHDLKNNQQFLSEEHPFYALKMSRLPIIVVDAACRFQVKGLNFLAVPYVPNGRFRAALDTLGDWKSDKPTAIFAHQEFAGAQMGAITSVEGDPWSESEPLVISGHIHEYQELAGVIYVGTPIQHNFDDSDAKTVSLWTWPEDGSDGMTHSRIDLGCKKKKIVHVTAEQALVYVPADNVTELKLKVSGTQAEVFTAMKSQNVKKLRGMGHKVVLGKITLVGDEIGVGKIEAIVNFSYALRGDIMGYLADYPRLDYWYARSLNDNMPRF